MRYQSEIPAGTSGAWQVVHFTLKREDLMLDFGNIRAGRSAHPGDYVRLTRNGAPIMSDTPAELRDLWPLEYHATGTVLMHGLGLGIAAELALQKDEVSHVTVIENSPDVMKLVAPTLARKWGKRLTIIEGDAFLWRPKDARFDTIWSDIWDALSEDNLPEMTKLARMWARRKKWHGFWGKEFVLRQRRSQAAFNW